MKRSKKFEKLSNEDLVKIREKKSHSLECSCGRIVKNVSIDAVAVKCPICTTMLVPIEKKIPQESSGFPRGWKMYGEFVHQDGRVFHKGVEDPNLKGKLKPTDLNQIKEKALVNKKNKKDREAKKEARLLKQFEKKQEIKKKEKLASTKTEYSDEDKQLLNKIKSDIILDVIEVDGGKFEAVDKNKNKYSHIINNIAKLKYAFKGSKKIIGKRLNKEIINWKVYNG